MRIWLPDRFNARNASKLNNLSTFSRRYTWLRFIWSFSSPLLLLLLLLLHTRIRLLRFRIHCLVLAPRLPFVTYNRFDTKQPIFAHTNKTAVRRVSLSRRTTATPYRFYFPFSIVFICVRSLYTVATDVDAFASFGMCKYVSVFTLCRIIGSLLHSIALSVRRPRIDRKLCLNVVSVVIDRRTTAYFSMYTVAAVMFAISRTKAAHTQSNVRSVTKDRQRSRYVRTISWILSWILGTTIVSNAAKFWSIVIRISIAMEASISAAPSVTLFVKKLTPHSVTHMLRLRAAHTTWLYLSLPMGILYLG